MSGFVSLVLLPVRYVMVTGFAVLGLLYYDRLNLRAGGRLDFEQVMPSAVNEFVPVGLLGMLIAGLLAAFLGSFSGTLNAAQAYIVNDLYLKYLKPHASNREISLINYTVGVTVVVVSIIFGFFAKDVNTLLQWIVSALYGSYIAANVFKWYWWRFNAHGYFWGMVAGLAPALYLSWAYPGVLPLYLFPVFFACSLVGCLIGTYATSPTDDETLIRFYRSVRPWGFWKPIHDKVVAIDPEFRPNTHFSRDMVNVVVGTIWQTSLVLLPIYVVLLRLGPALLALGLAVLTSWILKFNWLDHLEDDDPLAVHVEVTTGPAVALGELT